MTGGDTFMDVQKTIRDILETHRAGAEAMLADSGLARSIEQASDIIAAALDTGGSVYAFGNGGSAADAQHFTSELVGRFRMKRQGLRAVALTTDASIMTSLTNDFGYDEVFSRQIEALGRAGDVAVAFSTSGRSPNVLRAVMEARDRGLAVIGLTGTGGTELIGRCDAAIVIPSDDTPRVQEGHCVAYHIICELVESMLFPTG